MNQPRDPSFSHASLSFGGVVCIVIAGLLWFGINLHSLLIISLVWVAANAKLLGHHFVDVRKAMISGIEKGLGAIFIFILIGAFIASLIEAGTIGSLVYYGVDILHPAIFLPAGLVLCSLMSVATGTAWGTVGTIGIVLIGLGSAIGIPLPLVAGMVVSGASFGDKMSPVSDTTVLASMSAETDVYSHIRGMLYTTVPAYLIALVLFTALGLQYASQTISPDEIVSLKTALASEFSIGLLTLLPLAAVLGMSLLFGGLFASFGGAR